MLDRRFDGTLAIWIADPRRVGDDVVMGQRGGVHRVELGLVQVGLGDAFFQVVQHDVPATAAKVSPGLLVQPRPRLLAGAPHHPAKAVPGVAQRGHEQPRLAIPLGAGHARGRALAVVDLHLLAGHELQPVELLGLALAQLAHEAHHRAVAGGESELVDQVLVDRHGVASQPQLRLNEAAMRLARRGARRSDRRQRSRWAPWGNLRFRAGGHPGGICRRGGKALLVRADRLAVDPRDALDLSLAGPRVQQGPDGCL